MDRQLAFAVEDEPELVTHICPQCAYSFERVRSAMVVACPSCLWRWFPSKASR